MAEIKEESAVCVPADEKFGLIPDYQLTKKEKKILKLVEGGEAADFAGVCRMLDMKPSKLEEKTACLFSKGLLAYGEDGMTYVLTPSAVQLLSMGKEERKNQKKFREFLNSMNEAEQDEFFRLCDRFQYTEEPDRTSGTAGEGK